MTSKGIISPSLKEKEIADFLINLGYEPFDVIPLCCILSGSRAQGLSIPNSDRDYLGVHLMNTWDALNHPDFRTIPQVIRHRFNNNFELIPNGTKGGSISLDSFELWKFITLYLKGSYVVYELLYLPTIHINPSIENLFDYMREGVTNRLGKAAKGYSLNQWSKKKGKRKVAALSYYRLIQAIYLLRECEFEWQIGNLLDYIEPSGLVKFGKVVLGQYINPKTRTKLLYPKEIDKVNEELYNLSNEVDKSMIITRLPDQVPKQILKKILDTSKRLRASMI